MLFDSHAHVNIPSADVRFRPEYSINSLLSEMDKHKIDKSVVMINPTFRFFKCPKDNKHKVAVQDTDKKNTLRLHCIQCNTTLYEGPDPTRIYNLELLEKIEPFSERFFPMLTITLSNSTIPFEVSFFESHFSNKFVGYKVHPRICFRPLDEITIFPTTRPILIHTGVDFPPTQTNLNFVRNYKGTVILAHAGRFDSNFLYFTKNFPNVYIDTAPSSLMYKGKLTDLHPPFNTLISKPNDIYKYLIEQIGEDKLLFGSDVPWGNYSDEIEIFNSGNFSKDVYDKISYLNLLSALNLN